MPPTQADSVNSTSPPALSPLRILLAAIGPGILLAAAAIGVSHLVQATRAGAGFGFAMIPVLLLACITKYPFLEFGPRYAASTGQDLVEGYRKLGPWAVWICAALTFGSMFIIMAALTVVTAAIAQFLLTLYLPDLRVIPPAGWSAIIIALCLALLLIGRYRALERTMKLVMALLLLSTIAAVAIALFNPAPIPSAQATASMDTAPWWGAANFAFLLAFMGWMPIPIDSAIWNSIWVQEHARTHNRPPDLRATILDFRLGYTLAAVVAVLFLALGALVMRGRVTELADGAGFVQQLIGTYAETLGRWSIPVIAIAALTTMLSTTLVVLDAFPRAMHRLTQAIRNIDPTPNHQNNHQRSGNAGWGIAQAIVAMGIILFSLQSMKTMVDLATTLSFLTAPVLATINYLVITHHAPPHARPGKAMRWLSIVSIVFLALFSTAYLFWRFA